MATYHLSVKFGGKGQAANHADYIERKEKYRDRQDLEYSAHGNMPEWARDNPSHFWQAADQFERANGSTYRELEIALPRELTPEQRLELVQDFVRQEAGERHAWSFAIHNPKASIDGGEQPHAHIMMSQRVNDGIERTPEQYFRRYNARYPERGGAKKDSGSLTPTQQKEQLRELRKRWEVKHNEHMRKHGFERGFIDCRTLKEQGIERPTHVFVQAGVGSLAGAVVGYFAHKYKDNPPVMAVCEASAADCLYRSAMKADGSLVNVTGDLETIMAGLACGEANTIGWDILRNHVTVFASCPDWMSAKATRIYANPLENDPKVVSGESGSVPLGLCYTALHDADAKDLKEALKLDENSNILVISTEGDTDPVRYREIVWDGLYGTDKSLSE